MIYDIKICKNGEVAPYKTTVDISEENGRVRFFFTADQSGCYCPYDEYNKLHSDGDACEILIGCDTERKAYYEMEVSAKGALMLAKIVNHGPGDDGVPVIETHFIEDCFFAGKAEKTASGYTAAFTFDKKCIAPNGERIYFNAYRLETDGGEQTKKHLFALSPTMRPRFHFPEYFPWLDEYVK